MAHFLENQNTLQPITSPHIAVVDDDDEIRTLLAKFLTTHHYKVSTARNTEDLAQLLHHNTLDAIILDVMLPKESGITYLVNNRSQLQLPVIILTALGTIDDRVNSLALGADSYISKPFEPKELLSKLNTLIVRYQARI